MDQTSAANTRKQSSGKSVGGQQSQNEAGGNKGARKHGNNAGQEKKQNQANSGSQGGGQTKQTQNQQQQQSTSKQAQPGKAESSKAMPVATGWNFFEQMKPPAPQPAPTPNAGVAPSQKNRNAVGKQGSQDKYAELNKGNKSNDGSNTAKNRQNGKGQQNKAGGNKSTIDSYFEPEDDANTKGKGPGGPKKQTSNDFGNGDPAIMNTDGSGKSGRGRELEKFSFGGPADDLGTLEDSGKRDSQPYNQFAGRNPSSYSWNQYSTSLDESKLSADTIAKGKKLEKEIEGKQSTNRHLREERGQVPVKEDDVDEESRYGEAHRGATGTHSKLDGLRHFTAPKGKFKTFNKKVNPKELDNMTEKFIKNLAQKDSTIGLLAPNHQQSAQSVQVKPNQVRTVTNTNQQPKFAAQKAAMPPPQKPAMPPPAQKTAAPVQPVQQQPKATPVAETAPAAKPKPAEAAAPANPFASSAMKISNSNFEFKPASQPFQPSRPAQTPNFVPTQGSNMMSSQPFKPTMPGPPNQGSNYGPKPYNQPVHNQGYQPHMHQNNNYNQGGYNQGHNQGHQNYNQGGYQGNNYRNNYNNQGGYNNNRYNNHGHNHSNMPMPGGPQSNMMPQQQHAPNQGYQGQYGSGSQSFQQKSQQMPMPNNNQQMPPPNSAPKMGQMPLPQNNAAPKQNETKPASTSEPNPFAAFAKAGSEFKPTATEFKPK